MGGKSSSDKNSSVVQGVCPAGWHLPSSGEWSTLVNYVDPSTSCKKLKSTSGWNSYTTDGTQYSGNGTDEYGFSALPGGRGDSDGSFDDADDYGIWWSATENGGGSSMGHYWYMQRGNASVYSNAYDKSKLLSVRCLQD
jgi:uncharacterized protein (TIGR02145 family)